MSHNLQRKIQYCCSLLLETLERFLYEPILFLNKTVVPKAWYSFRHCFFDPRTVGIIKYEVVRKSCRKFYLKKTFNNIVNSLWLLNHDNFPFIKKTVHSLTVIPILTFSHIFSRTLESFRADMSSTKIVLIHGYYRIIHAPCACLI